MSDHSPNDIYIRGGRLIDPANKIDAPRDVHIRDGKITAVGKNISAPSADKNAREIDATGLWILPGLIDLCARAGEPTIAAFAAEAQAAATGGVTRFVCPPDTLSVTDTPAAARMLQQTAADAGFARAHPLGALTVNLDGKKLADIARLLDAGCVGFSNGRRAVEDSLVMRRAMQYASAYPKAVFVTPQDSYLQGNGVVHEGETSTRLGLPAIPYAAETVGVARDLALVETSGARAHLQNLSSGRAVEMLSEAQARGIPATATVAIHHLHLTEQHIGLFDTRYKVYPPLRTAADRDALIAGVKNGIITAICSDHQPQPVDAKLSPFAEAAAGISGVDTLLSLTLQLIHNKELSRATAIGALTAGPAAILGIDAGSLRVGAPADICIADPNSEWKLDAKAMQSFGKNSPWLGQSLTGKAVGVLIDGEIVYAHPRLRG